MNKIPPFTRTRVPLTNPAPFTSYHSKISNPTPMGSRSNATNHAGSLKFRIAINSGNAGVPFILQNALRNSVTTFCDDAARRQIERAPVTLNDGK